MPLIPQPRSWSLCRRRRAAQLYDQAVVHGERYAVHLRVPTGEGEAVLVWEEEGFLVKTLDPPRLDE